MTNVTILGSGTSHGVPMVGCGCPVCRSTDPRDIRNRSSILIHTDSEVIVIDTATEFRLQAVRSGVTRLDAVLFTHAHADHVHGFDDIRPLTRELPVDVFGTARVLRDIKKRFDYVFRSHPEGGGVPRVKLRKIVPLKPFTIGTVEVLPIKVLHGSLPILGFRIGNFAYITDCSRLPEESLAALSDLDILVIGALRKKPHPTHLSFSQAVELIEKINPKQTYLTHLSHNHSHKEIGEYIRSLSQKKIEPAYDGLSFTLS